MYRLNYYDGSDLSTTIYVDFTTEQVWIKNYTEDLIARAFGVIESPTFSDFEEFLESRCAPRTRDRLKVYLRECGVDYYDPFSIVLATQGRMADDAMWLEIEEVSHEQFERESGKILA